MNFKYIIKFSSIVILLIFLINLSTQQLFASTYGTGKYDVGVFNNSDITNQTNSVLNTSEIITCTGIKPATAPYLFQINRVQDKAIIYFSPAVNPVDNYVIYYGPNLIDYKYAVKLNLKSSTGAVKYTINYLSNYENYAFKIQGFNGCVPGPISNALIANKNFSSRNKVLKFYPGVADRIFYPIQREISKTQNKITNKLNTNTKETTATNQNKTSTKRTKKCFLFICW